MAPQSLHPPQIIYFEVLCGSMCSVAAGLQATMKNKFALSGELFEEDITLSQILEHEVLLPSLIYPQIINPMLSPL